MILMGQIPLAKVPFQSNFFFYEISKAISVMQICKLAS